MKMVLVMLLLALPGLACATDSIDEIWPVTLDSGRALDLHLRLPAAKSEQPLTAIILFGGFQGAAEILEHVKTDLPVVRASFRYPWNAPSKVTLSTIPSIIESFSQAVHDTFDGIDRLIEILREHSAVDNQRIVLVGASAGAPFATISGQRNEVPGVIIVQGFGKLADVIAHQFVLSWSSSYGEWVAPIAWLLARVIVWWAELPAPEAFASQFSKKQLVLMLNADADQRIPPQATESLWSAIDRSQAHSERLELPGGHLRGYNDPAMDAIMASAMNWMIVHDFMPHSKESQPP